jgi:hypothetical protein
MDGIKNNLFKVSPITGSWLNGTMHCFNTAAIDALRGHLRAKWWLDVYRAQWEKCSANANEM